MSARRRAARNVERYSEWYAVTEVDSSGAFVGEPARRTGPSILGTFQPTSDQIRRWAYDRDLYFASSWRVIPPGRNETEFAR